MNSVLITGANRGLGLGMVKYLTKHNKAQKIIATCRKTSEVRANSNNLPIGAIIAANMKINHFTMYWYSQLRIKSDLTVK